MPSLPHVCTSIPSGKNLSRSNEGGSASSQIQFVLEKHIADVNHSLEGHYEKILQCLQRHLHEYMGKEYALGQNYTGMRSKYDESFEEVVTGSTTSEISVASIQQAPDKSHHDSIGERNQVSNLHFDDLPATTHFIKAEPSIGTSQEVALCSSMVTTLDTQKTDDIPDKKVRMSNNLGTMSRDPERLSKSSNETVFHFIHNLIYGKSEEFSDNSSVSMETEATEGIGRRNVSRHHVALHGRWYWKQKHKNRWWRLMKRPSYSWYVCLLVFSDAFLIAYESEVASVKALGAPSASFSGIEDSMPLCILSDILCFAFILDLILRLLARRLEYFAKSRWHIFNATCVILLLLECIVRHAWFDERSHASVRIIVQQVSLLRMLRVPQVIIQTKVIQDLPLCKVLRMLINSISEAFGFAIFSMSILAFFCVFVACFITEGFLSACLSEDVFTDDCSGLNAYFGTIGRSTLSLYKSAFGGDDWSKFYGHLGGIGTGYQVAFLFFQAYTLVVILNVFNAVLVECALKRSRQDQANEQLKDDADFVLAMGDIFRKMAGKNGAVQLIQFKDFFKDAKNVALFKQWGIDVNRHGHIKDRFFHLLDSDRSGEVDMIEFQRGCKMLRGEAKSLDVANMSTELKMMLRTQHKEIARLIHDGVVKKIKHSKGDSNASLQKNIHDRETKLARLSIGDDISV